MSSHLTRDGSPWTPEYIEAINTDACIGCGRCFKVCDRGVLELKGITEEGEIVDSDDDDAFRQVMSIGQGGACVGCNACALVCGKNAQTHVSA